MGMVSMEAIFSGAAAFTGVELSLDPMILQ
jgi:hypothetical protein